MHDTSMTEPLCRLAVCREEMSDGKEWSIYVLGETLGPIEVCLTSVSYEWGDSGHSVTPNVRVTVPPDGSGLLWREHWEGAELSMELEVELRLREKTVRLAYELGKLYRRKSPAIIPQLSKPGWLLLPDRSSVA
ncbi:MAG: hypothetical protein JNK85_29490 [Verrucomicrobiales bacterium]|nr:hypothetical protein [Verrucomicrobiales bacterium]